MSRYSKFKVWYIIITIYSLFTCNVHIPVRAMFSSIIIIVIYTALPQLKLLLNSIMPKIRGLLVKKMNVFLNKKKSIECKNKIKSI